MRQNLRSPRLEIGKRQRNEEYQPQREVKFRIFSPAKSMCVQKNIKKTDPQPKYFI